MREIKFRGKVLQSSSYPEMVGEWVYGYFFEDLVGGEVCSFIFNAPTSFMVDPRTVGQFTGLRDSNENKIYSGDVIKTLSGIAEVVFDSGMFALESPGSEAIDYDLFLVSQLSVIIGNVFDNHKLIEK